MRAAGDLFVHITFAGYFLFCALFFRSHWWRTAIGRHVFAFMAVPTILLALAELRRIVEFFGSNWFDLHRDTLIFWSYLAMAFVVWWRVIILIVAQRFDPSGTMARNDAGMETLKHKKSDGDTDPNLKPVG